MKNKKYQKKFKFLEHTADVKFQAFGNKIEKVFENSSLALKETICGKIKIKENKERIIKVKGKDFESLLYNFLEELLLFLDGENFFMTDVKKIKIDKKLFKLEAEIAGGDAKNYSIHLDVKAVTYNEMFVKKIKDKWTAQVVLDV